MGTEHRCICGDPNCNNRYYQVEKEVPLLEYSRLLEIMRQFGITETDTLKHRLEDWDRENNW